MKYWITLDQETFEIQSDLSPDLPLTEWLAKIKPTFDTLKPTWRQWDAVFNLPIISYRGEELVSTEELDQDPDRDINDIDLDSLLVNTTEDDGESV